MECSKQAIQNGPCLIMYRVKWKETNQHMSKQAIQNGTFLNGLGIILLVWLTINASAQIIGLSYWQILNSFRPNKDLIQNCITWFGLNLNLIQVDLVAHINLSEGLILLFWLIIIRCLYTSTQQGKINQIQKIKKIREVRLSITRLVPPFGKTSRGITRHCTLRAQAKTISIK